MTARVVIAFDSFKGSIAASVAVHAFAAGWRAARPGDELIPRPMADGGEGTLEAFAAAVPSARRVPVVVRGPHGADVAASWLMLPAAAGDVGVTAVVELASTSGFELLDQPSPWDADTSGFGQAIADALDSGARRLILGIGSSASTDGGAGVLTALGARLTDATGAPIAPGLRGLGQLADVDLSGIRRLPEGGVTVLCDVTSPLTGPRGAAAVFGPQKGLDADGIRFADDRLTRFAELLGGLAHAETPGAGAAGGTGYALLAWGARLVPGAAEIARRSGLAEAVSAPDTVLVVTGEGSYDAQSRAGKVPAFVADAADAAGVPVALVAGRIADDADLAPFRAVVALTDVAGSAAAAVADPERWLKAAGSQLARLTDGLVDG
ncbi:MAG: glycerate kinase [Microbacterium sp.]|uniref:glycerate kinase n=1 Tax=Microbacterium sp. TaxID=51671 RepID=UPI001AC62F36|nr:glycerate kinase [Microbacterium sp.]MBN9177676.1 glycerate kinase [Microbacterium sp.]